MLDPDPEKKANGDHCENQEVTQEAEGDEVARFGRRRLHGIAHHVTVDDDAKRIHEPGSRGGREHHKDQDRLGDEAEGQRHENCRGQRGQADCQNDNRQHSFKIVEGARPEAVVRHEDNVGSGQHGERRRSQRGARAGFPLLILGLFLHGSIPFLPLERASRRDGSRVPVIPRLNLAGHCPSFLTGT